MMWLMRVPPDGTLGGARRSPVVPGVRCADGAAAAGTGTAADNDVREDDGLAVGVFGVGAPNRPIVM